MKSIWNFLRILFALFFVYAGTQHFIKPDFFNAFVPKFLIFKLPIIYASGAIEIVFGVLLLITRYTHVAASGILILMLLFLPIHIWDVITDTPAIGSHQAALLRLLMQFVLIALAYKFRNTNNNG